ncbi:MAG: hypothetical protein QG597_2675, partial [Actinomycetota bacterium]|nr:hypothetical protein [Actinomycetota bacterium]
MPLPSDSSTPSDPDASVRELEAEVARLRAELAAQTATQTAAQPSSTKPAKSPRDKRHWARNFWSVLLIT